MRIAVMILALVVSSSSVSVAAQMEAALTQGACGTNDVAVSLRPLNRETAEEGVVLSQSRLNARLDDLIGRSLAVSITDNGIPVACSPLPSSLEEVDRAEFVVPSIDGAGIVGQAILREITPGVTTAIVAVARFEATEQNVEPASEQAATSASTGYDSASPAQIGKTLDVQGVRVTPSNPRFVDEYELTTPRGGFAFLVVDVRIENAGAEQRPYNYTNFSGEDKNSGAGYDSEFFFSADFLGADSLDPGEFVTGVAVIEVQATAQNVILKYDPIQFSDPDMYWEVSR